MVGTTVSHYRILEKLGEGGMGVVYKARDLRLDRLVCIKVLNAEHVKDESRKQRFVQEAKAASSLNHPNIVVIHEIDEADGADFIVMEFIAGKTLRQSIPSGGLPVRDALRYAVPVTSALAAAGAAGIIHRDITPGNIMVGGNGVVKVLDFGLAKLTAQEENAGDDTTRTIHVQTGEDTIVGTAAYMSPEQAEGRPVDARSDIFSFGAVLYEMLSGCRAFQGANRISTMAAILQREPKPLTEICSRVPRELERIVMRCLRKDPDRRFQHMADLKVALEELKEESDSGRLAPAHPAAPRRKWDWLALGAIAALVLLGAGAIWLRSSFNPSKPVVRAFRRLTFTGVSFDPAISPDGRILAFLSSVGGPRPDIWVQQIAGGEPVQITHEAEGAADPVFSPDGTEIAYNSHGAIYEISALGGSPRLITSDGLGPRYTADGSTIVFTRPQERWLHLFTVPRMGGTPSAIQPDAWLAGYPVTSPDAGKALTLLSHDGQEEHDLKRWWTIALPGGSLTDVVPPPASGAYAPSPLAWTRDLDSGQRWVIFGRVTGEAYNLFRVRVSSEGRVTADPEQLTSVTGLATSPSASGNGRLVFASAVHGANLWALPIDTDRGQVKGDPQSLTHVDGIRDDSPSVSRDGTKVAFFAGRSVAVKNLATEQETQLAPAPFIQLGTPPIITPDGATVAYYFWRFGKTEADIYLVPAAGGSPRRACENCGTPKGFSSDGTRLLMQNGSFRPGLDRIALLDVATGKFAIVLSDAQHSLWNAYYSWDDKWVAFLMQIGGERFRIYITPVKDYVPAGPDRWIQVTDGQYHDDHEQFSPDGSTMYFTSDRDGYTCIWAVRLDPASKRPLGAPFPVQHFHHTHKIYPGISAPNDMEVSVARDKIVTNLDEFRSDIWMIQLEPGK